MIAKGNGCDRYLNCFHGPPRLIWRGFGISNFHGVIEKGPIRNRKPRDTKDWIHQIADQWFLESFGARYRSEAMFCSGDKVMAAFYGNIYPVVPLDGYTFCWSPKYADFFSVSDKANLEIGDQETLIKLLENGEYRCEDLPAAIESGSEIMIRADGYMILAD